MHVLQGEREFARDNKTLGVFHLDGIPAAPRGVPQIEVTFDIDANGIVHVSAKDLGTGKETAITITSNTNMSKDDIEKAVHEAEQYAEEDKKRREEIDTRNNADQMVYQMEKTLKDAGDKLDQADKDAVQAEIDKLKETLKGDDIEAIKKQMEATQTKMYSFAEKLYKANAPQDGATPPTGGPAGGNPNGGNNGGDDNVYDADYKNVD